MLDYVIKRLAATIPVMAVVSLVVFSLLYIAPGDPAVVLAGDQATPADVERIRAALGLDRPFLTQFADWLWRVAHGDLGNSIATNNPVGALISQRIEPTLSLMALTILIAVGLKQMGRITGGQASLGAALVWLVGSLPTLLPVMMRK